MELPTSVMEMENSQAGGIKVLNGLESRLFCGTHKDLGFVMVAEEWEIEGVPRAARLYIGRYYEVTHFASLDDALAAAGCSVEEVLESRGRWRFKNGDVAA